MKSKFANVALRTSLIYAGVAAVWILLSGRTLTALVSDPATRERLEIYKGWAFVAVTALLLYTLLRSQLRLPGRRGHSNASGPKRRLRASEGRSFGRTWRTSTMEVICRRLSRQHRFTPAIAAGSGFSGYDPREPCAANAHRGSSFGGRPRKGLQALRPWTSEGTMKLNIVSSDGTAR